MITKQYSTILYLLTFLSFSFQGYSQEKCEKYYEILLKDKESEKNDSEIIKKSIGNKGEHIISILWKDNTKNDLVLYDNSVSDKLYNYVKLKDKILIKKGFNYIGIIRWESSDVFKIQSFKLCD